MHRRPLVRSLLAALAWAGAGTPSGRATAADEVNVAEEKGVIVDSGLGVDTTRVAAKTVAAAVPVLEANLPWRVPAEEKLVVHLYRTSEDYENAFGRADPKEPAPSPAAAAFRKRDSYLLVQPRAEPAYLEAVGRLPEISRFLACQQAVHQVADRADAPGRAFWPAWYAEGMADHVAHLCLRAAAGKEAAEPIFWQDRMHLVQDALAAGRLPRLDRLLHSRGAAYPISRLLVAQWGLFYGLLADDPVRLRAFHQRVRDLGEPSAPQGGARDVRLLLHENAFAEMLERVYGPPDALEKRWHERIATWRPAWSEGAASTERVGDELVSASYPGSSAFALRVEPAPAARFAVTVEWNALDLGARQADVYLAFERGATPRWLKVAFQSVGGKGTAALLAFADGVWQERYTVGADVEGPLVAPGAWHAAKIVVDAKTVLVDLGDKRVLEAAVPPGFDTLGSRVGIGALDGVVRFRGFETKPVAP